MSKVRVAIIGVGNCASSLVQGVEFYRGANSKDFVPGLMHVDLGGYLPGRHRVQRRVRRECPQGRARSR